MSLDPHVVIDRIFAAEGLLSGYVYTHLSVREDLKDLFESAVKCSGTKEPGYLFQGTYSYNRTQAADTCEAPSASQVSAGI